MTFLLPSLVVLALSLNLLLPLYKESYFFSLLVGEKVYGSGVFLQTNLFTDYGYGSFWASTSPLYDVFLFLLESHFGELGPGLLQVCLHGMFAMQAFLLLILASSEKEDKKNRKKRIHFVTMTSLLCVGSILYGLSLDPVLFFLVSLLLFLILVLRYENSERSFRNQLIAASSLIPFVFFDIRVMFIPLFSGLILFLSDLLFDKKRFQKIVYSQFFLVVTILVLPVLREGAFSWFQGLFVEFSLSRSVYPELYSFSHFILGYAVSFSMAFFCLLLIVSGIKVYNEIRKPKLFPLLLLFLVLILSVLFPFVRYVFTIALSVFLSRKIYVNKNHSESPGLGSPPENGIQRIEEMILRLGEGLGALSYSGRVFLVLAFSFVQVVSHLKYPVSELLLPAQKIDQALDQGVCPEIKTLRGGAYLAYRVQYFDSCRAEVSLFTLSSLSSDEIKKVRERFK
jgi:hypothetical protein